MTTSITYLQSISTLIAVLVSVIFIARFVLRKYNSSSFDPLKSRFPAFCFGFAWSLSLLIASFEITTTQPSQIDNIVEASHDILDIEVINKRTKTEVPKQVKKLPEVIDSIVFIVKDDTDTLSLVEMVVDADTTARITDTIAIYTPNPTNPSLAPLPLPVDPQEDLTTYYVVEEMPRFPGCESNETNTKEKEACANQMLLQYVHSMVKYPAIARENNITGTVVARFIVDKDGSISKINIIRDIGAGCGAEVEKVLNSMNVMDSKWRPGRQQGRPVKVLFTLPVKFSLE